MMDKKEVSKFIGKNVIIKFKPWEISKSKVTLDMLAKRLKPGECLPDFTYKKDKEVIVKIESIGSGLTGLKFWIYEERYHANRNMDDIEKIELYTGTEEHLQALVEKSKLTQVTRTNCFIATEIYGFYSDEVYLLQNWRDKFLNKHLLGKLFIWLYYLISPILTKIIKLSRIIRVISKSILDKILKMIYPYTK